MFFTINYWFSRVMLVYHHCNFKVECFVLFHGITFKPEASVISAYRVGKGRTSKRMVEQPAIATVASRINL